MPGINKRKYVGECMRYNKMIKRPLYLIAEILPKSYDGKILLNFFQKYYPREWSHLVQMQNSYLEKDRFLVSVGKKVRYKPMSPEKYFFSLPVVRNILCNSTKEKHSRLFETEKHELNFKKIEQKRQLAIDKCNDKIANNTELIQNIDPHYVDYYISFYHRKGITIEGKVEIVKDLSKYSSAKINTFFYKLNDSERNNQVRKIAFDYLQNTGKYVKLRAHFKGKQKEYMSETTTFNMTPEDLIKRIASNNIQTRKSFDFFISHSYLDQKKVVMLFKHLNKQGKVCYCDWTSDHDFLKREMAGKYTEEVLKRRIEQSKIVLYAKSQNANQSRWVEFELEFAESLGKEIKEIDIDSIVSEEISNELLKIM